jgi:RNA polymerase sigma-70 factor, ECF subfamily
MTKPEFDAALLARARRGDEAAFRALYDHHADAVFRFVARMLRDETAAEDALQEVFVRVFSALPRFDPAGPARLSTWIFTIARRVALTAIERTQQLRRREGDPPPPAAAATVTHDLRLVLEAAVAALPEAMRSTFVLRECCDLSYEEIAVVEAVDIGTVKSRLHRARANLAAGLSDEPDPAFAPTVTPKPPKVPPLPPVIDDRSQDIAVERQRHEVRAAKG